MRMKGTNLHDPMMSQALIRQHSLTSFPARKQHTDEQHHKLQLSKNTKNPFGHYALSRSATTVAVNILHTYHRILDKATEVDTHMAGQHCKGTGVWLQGWNFFLLDLLQALLDEVDEKWIWSVTGAGHGPSPRLSALALAVDDVTRVSLRVWEVQQTSKERKLCQKEHLNVEILIIELASHSRQDDTEVAGNTIYMYRTSEWTLSKCGKASQRNDKRNNERSLKLQEKAN